MLGREPGGGLIVSADAFNLPNRKLIVELAARLPRARHLWNAGLAPRGPDLYNTEVIDQYRSAAGYVGRILRRRKAADLPGCSNQRGSSCGSICRRKALGLQCR